MSLKVIDDKNEGWLGEWKKDNPINVLTMILHLTIITWRGVMFLELLELEKKFSTWDQNWGH